MNVFVIHSGADYNQVERILKSMKQNSFTLNPLMLENGGTFWKTDAAKRFGNPKSFCFLLALNHIKAIT